MISSFLAFCWGQSIIGSKIVNIKYVPLFRKAEANGAKKIGNIDCVPIFVLFLLEDAVEQLLVLGKLADSRQPPQQLRPIGVGGEHFFE